METIAGNHFKMGARLTTCHLKFIQHSQWQTRATITSFPWASIGSLSHPPIVGVKLKELTALQTKEIKGSMGGYPTTLCMSAPPREGLYLGDPEATPRPLAAGTAENVNVVTRRLRVLTRSGSLTLKTCGPLSKLERPSSSIWEVSGDTSEPGNWRCKSHRRQWSLSAWLSSFNQYPQGESSWKFYPRLRKMETWWTFAAALGLDSSLAPHSARRKRLLQHYRRHLFTRVWRHLLMWTTILAPTQIRNRVWSIQTSSEPSATSLTFSAGHLATSRARTTSAAACSMVVQIAENLSNHPFQNITSKRAISTWRRCPSTDQATYSSLRKDLCLILDTLSWQSELWMEN